MRNENIHRSQNLQISHLFTLQRFGLAVRPPLPFFFFCLRNFFSLSTACFLFKE